LSRLYAAIGNNKKALKLADKSCAIAEHQQAAFELAQSQLVRGRIAEQLGLPDATEQTESAQQKLAEFEEIIQRAMAEDELGISIS
jgi:hypothetical protein